MAEQSERVSGAGTRSAALRWVRAIVGRRSQEMRDADRIGYVAAGVVVAVGLLGLAGGFAILVPDGKEAMEGRLALSLERRATVLNTEIRSAWGRSKALATPAIIQTMRQLAANAGDGRARARLADILRGLPAPGFTAVAFRTAAGVEVGRSGTFLAAPALAVPVQLPTPSSLLWDDGYVLRTHIELVDGARVVGTMIAEWRLDPAIVGSLSRPGRFGDSLDFAVCAAKATGRMDCFPLHSAGGRVLRDLPDRVDGHFIPMHYALEGKSGVARAQDYRGVASIAAYQPIGTLGLGSVLRLDADQLYAPIVRRLLPLVYVFPLLALGAILLLRVQTLPFVRRLEESEERFRTMADYTYDWEYWRGPNCRIVYMSPSCERVTGYTQAEFLADPSLVERIVHPDDRQQLATHLEHYRDDSNHSIDFRIVTKQGAVRWLAHSCSPIFRADGEFRGRRISNHEITDRKRAEEELARAKERLELALEASSLSIWEYDIREGLMVLDEHWAELTGGAPGETVAAPEELMRRVHPEDAPRMLRAAAATIRGGAAFFQEEVRIQCPDGWKWILCSGKVDARDADGRAVRMVGTNRDITQHKSAEERIHHWAYFDRLTNLPNRRLLEDRLQQLLVQARRKRSLVALLFIDLDRFKPINDEHGHEVGDWLLQAAAGRMLACVRQSDTVARIGGDEFVAVLPETRTVDDALVVAEKIRLALAEPFVLADGRPLAVSSSIGIAFYPAHARGPRDLLRHADEAMYEAKAAGRNAIVVFGGRSVGGSGSPDPG